MNKANIVESNEFHMDIGDVLHYILIVDSGVTPTINLASLGVNDNSEEVPDAVVALSASDITSSSFSANWNRIENAQSYYLDVATTSTFTAGTFVAGYNNLSVGDVIEYPVVGLDDAITYYYRVRGSNDNGTGISSNIITTTTSYAAVTDADGNVYTYVTIGTQQWMVENFRSTKYADGALIPNITANSFNDWFLPSKDELNDIYVNLQAAGKANYNLPVGPAYYHYPSSSENGAAGCWWQRFDTGEQMTDPAYEIAKASEVQYYIPCRTFISSDVLSLGDGGEAGGLIFHITDNGDGTYTYYEAPPSQVRIIWGPWDKWSNVDLLIGTGTAVGTGQTNTAAIIAQVGHTESAAKLCDDLVDGGWPDDVTGAYCWYNNDIANKADYGALYNWYAVNNAHLLAPATWKVPSLADLDVLAAYLGGYGVTAGGRLKESGIAHWTTPNTGAVNDVGFYALPGGTRNVLGVFSTLLTYGFYHASDNVSADNNGSFYMAYNSDNLTKVASADKNYGFSIRLMRDV